MAASIIDRVRWHQLRVSPKTIWSFVELTDSAGRRGVGEATLGQQEPQMRDALARFEPVVLGRRPDAADLDDARRSASALAEFAVISALDQALWDLASRQQGVSVSEALGGVRRHTVSAYANINRGISSRTPEGFAAQARRAVRDGFRAIKIAPFDEVTLHGDAGIGVESWGIDAGLSRIAAVCDAIGDAVALMVDCHWRLNREAAKAVLRAVEPLHLDWFECPVPETPELFDTIREIRGLANGMGVRLAGCEQMSLVAGFTPLLEAGCYDVMMPDAKYVGGLREMLRVAEVLQSYGVGFSPHNPSGPVCHAASLHVCAVSAWCDRLETQYAETPLFDAVVGGALPAAVDGQFAVPSSPGLGVDLDAALARELASEDGYARHAS